MTSEVDYYRKRAIQERIAAQAASCPTAREIHDELAAAYRFRVSMLSETWAKAGVAIALHRLANEQQIVPLPGPAKGSITAVPNARSARRDRPGALTACMGG